MIKLTIASILLVMTFILLRSCPAQAQQNQAKSIDMVAHKQACKRFCDDRIGETFVPIDAWKCIDGTAFDLEEVKGPTVFYMGFAGCAPCREAMPVYAALSMEAQYSNYNFVYMTFDDSETIVKEIVDSKVIQGNRVRIIIATNKYMHKIAQSFPTIYFIDANKIVKQMYAFGALSGPISKKEDWYPMLGILK